MCRRRGRRLEKSLVVAAVARVVLTVTLMLDVVLPFNCCLVNRGGHKHCGATLNMGTFFFFKAVLVTVTIVFANTSSMRTTTNSRNALTANVNCVTTTLMAKLSYVNNNVTITDTTDTTLNTVDRSRDVLNGSLVFMNLTRNITLCKLVVSFVVLKRLWSTSIFSRQRCQCLRESRANEYKKHNHARA